jgi:very-short-patch-repair endonuclease
MAEERKYRRTTIRGYIKTEELRPELIELVLRRRGPARPVIENDIREAMEAYAEDQRIIGTLPELIVHWHLTRRGLIDGIHFDFQSSQFGGRLELGGAVIDFLFRDRPLAVRVQGEYWHEPWEQKGLGAHDEAQRLMIEGMGYEVQDLWERTIMDHEELEDWMQRHIDTQVIARAP